jgi:hypothetical protein
VRERLESKLIYFPEPYPAGLYSAAEGIEPREGAIAPRIEDCALTAEDGVRLHAWFATPCTREGGEVRDVPALGTLLWLHGNAGNLSYRLDMLAALMTLPARVLLLDYRGYGKSEGQPSEEGLYRDARAAWRYLTSERGVPAGEVVVLGKSLGGAPACQLATEVEPAGLIVQSSFTSVPDMAARLMPLVPRMLIKTKMDSLSKVRTIACPKLFVHGPRDEVVLYDMGQRLFEAACEPKEFYAVPNAGHNETWLAGGEAYLDTLRAFLKRCCAGSA